MNLVYFKDEDFVLSNQSTTSCIQLDTRDDRLIQRNHEFSISLKRYNTMVQFENSSSITVKLIDDDGKWL